MSVKIPHVSDADQVLQAFRLSSPLGSLCGVASPQGLCLLSFASPEEALAEFPLEFPTATRAELLRSLIEVKDDGPMADAGADTGAARRPKALLGSWLQSLRRYLHGESRQLEIPVDLRLARTPFHRAVYEHLLRVGPGQTTTYGDLARAVGRPLASRAVGQAVGKNPVGLVIPCHRVLGKDGSLHGFAFGLAKKAALLKLEGVDADVVARNLGGGAKTTVTPRSWEREVRADSR
jgi:O-6-methylguanine DNA methyltransferase